MLAGAKLMAMTALDLLVEPENLAAAKRTFEKQKEQLETE
jgi:hypothetical protein